MHIAKTIVISASFAATALFAAEPEQPRFLEALDECETLWHAEKYDQLYEYVGELERKNPEHVSSRILFALREGLFGCKYAKESSELRRLTNQVCRVLCEVNPEFLSRLGEMADKSEGLLTIEVSPDHDKKNDDPRTRTNKKWLTKVYWPTRFLDVPFLVPDISLVETQQVVKCEQKLPRKLAMKHQLDLMVKAFDIPIMFGQFDELDNRISFCQKKELLEDYVFEAAIVSGLKGLVEKFGDNCIRADGYRAVEILRDNSMYAKQILKDLVERENPPIFEGDDGDVEKAMVAYYEDDAKRMAVWALLQFAHDDPEIAEYLRQLPPKIDKSNRKTKEYLDMAIRHLDEGCQRHFLTPNANAAQGETSVFWRERLEERASEENLGEAEKARELRKE